MPEKLLIYEVKKPIKKFGLRLQKFEIGIKESKCGNCEYWDFQIPILDSILTPSPSGSSKLVLQIQNKRGPSPLPPPVPINLSILKAVDWMCIHIDTQRIFFVCVCCMGYNIMQ